MEGQKHYEGDETHDVLGEIKEMVLFNLERRRLIGSRIAFFSLIVIKEMEKDPSLRCTEEVKRQQRSCNKRNFS